MIKKIALRLKETAAVIKRTAIITKRIAILTKRTAILTKRIAIIKKRLKELKKADALRNITLRNKSYVKKGGAKHHSARRQFYGAFFNFVERKA